jgi:AI-2 transport protein TqsA
MTGDSGRTGGRAVLFLAAFVVLVAGLRAASTLLLPFMLAVLLTLACLPLQQALLRRRVPVALAVPVTVLVALFVVGVPLVFLGGTVQDFIDQAPFYQQRISQMWTGLASTLEARGARLPDRLFTETVNPAMAMDLAARTLRGVVALLSNLFLVFLTVVFLLLEAAGLPGKLRIAFGRQSASAHYEAMAREIQRYLAIKSGVSLLTGILVAVPLTLLGVDFALLWGVLAFLLNFIPNLGSILAAIPPVLLALIQLGPGHALGVAGIFLAVNVVMGNVVEPHWMGQKLGLSTLVVFASLVFWGWVWGPIGMLLSVPLTMIVKILLQNTPDLRWIAVLLDSNPSPPPAPASPGGPAA